MDNRSEDHELNIDGVRGLDEQVAGQLARTFKALSDPTRVRIIAALADHELCVHELAAVLGMSHSAISHQLGTLRECVWYLPKRAAMFTFAIDDDHIHHLFRQSLEHIQHG